MGDFKNSEFLDKILSLAETIRMNNDCSEITRDHIILAAIQIIQDKENYKQYELTEEYKQVNKLLAGLSKDPAAVKKVLDIWKGRNGLEAEKTALSLQKWKAGKAAKNASQPNLSANFLLDIIIREGTPGLQILLGKAPAEKSDTKGSRKVPVESEGPREKPRPAEREDPKPSKKESANIAEIIQQTKNLQNILQHNVLGQPHAVSMFAAGFFQGELQSAIEKDRVKPKATFLFAGPPGVGKTFLSEEAAKILDLPYRRFDMSEYTGPNATDELSGSDANYKGSAEGQLTGFVAANPRCVLLFDEIEKASLEVIHLFLQVLDAGRLRDNRTDKEVSFKDAILIFTTNAGKELYENESSGQLSILPRDVILDALSHDINPKTKEPYFPQAICSRFASGNVLMFNHLSAHILRSIVENQLNARVTGLKEAMGIEVAIDPIVPTAILLAEGAAADARRVKSRADSFFSGELYELFRLTASGHQYDSAQKIKKIRISIDFEHCPAQIQQFFSPTEQIHALLYSDQELPADSRNDQLLVLHPVHTMEEAKRTIEHHPVQMILCDLFSQRQPDEKTYLNQEDVCSPGRDFLNDMLTNYSDVPVLLMEHPKQPFSDEEKESYYRRGVRSFISSEEKELEQGLIDHTNIIIQQNSLSELARANRLIQFETAQKINGSGDQADVILYDLKLVKSVKAEDSDNILSLLSTPDVHFSDIIGAEDAKKELAYFVRYMKNPQKYRAKGAPVPKGLLLYGPPGTGKTMLAKAFAAESGATFIATEGSQFFKQYISQGSAMVRKLFAAARRYAPSVLFIDEIDTIARARTGRDTDMGQDSEQILTTFFAEMDGFRTSPGKPVFVLGATNYGVTENDRLRLDPAMLRRFDRRILVDLPKLENRKQYLAEQIGKKSIFQVGQNAIDSLAERSTGMSLAQLSSILDLSIRSAIHDDLSCVTDAMLEEAFETFNNGESRKWSPEITLRTARHEAGHVLISWLSGEKPSFATIISRGDFGGYMQFANQENKMGYTKRELLNKIRTALGGRAAEIVYYGKEDGISTGASGDLKSATDTAVRMLSRYGMDEQFGLAVIDQEQASDSAAHLLQSQVNDLLKKLLTEAVQIILENKAKIDALVENLLKYNSLRANDIDRIMENGIISKDIANKSTTKERISDE